MAESVDAVEKDVPDACSNYDLVDQIERVSDVGSLTPAWPPFRMTRSFQKRDGVTAEGS